MLKYKLLIVIIFSATTVLSQSNHYWGTVFNTESSLLGDAVVGDNSGITSIYFNPAGIQESENNQLSLSANLITLSYEYYSNALGKDINLIDYGFRVQPRFVSIMYRPKNNKKAAYQFAILNRANKDKFIYNDVSYSKDILYKGYGEKYQGSFELKSNYSDYWGGFGAAYQVSDRFSIGASTFLSVKNYYYSKNININIYPNLIMIPDSVSYYSAHWATSLRQTSYDVRLLGKIGVRYKFGNLKLGLNVSLPSLKLWGNSDVIKSVVQIGLQDFDTAAPSYTHMESGKYRYVDFKDPFSIAFGMSYNSPLTKAHYYFSAEYFASIDRYKIIDGTRVVKSAQNNYSPGSNFLSFYSQGKSLVNFAFGYQYKFNDKVELLAGIKTDFDAAPQSTASSNSETYVVFQEIPANIYHFNIGSKLNILKSAFTVGFQLSYGRSDNNYQYVNFSNPIIYDHKTLLGIQGKRTKDMTYLYFDLGFYFSFLWGF